MLGSQKLIKLASISLFLVATVRADTLAYVVTGSQQFGTVNLTTGAFQQIGKGTPEPDSNLIPGPNGSLFSLAALSGSLVTINAATGVTTVVGPTGLGASAFSLGAVGGSLYMTDFQNNFYSVNATTGAAHLIGPTGIPADPTVPFTFNADGTLNLCDETLYGVGNKLYATFDSYKINPGTLATTQAVSPELWQIDPATGVATAIAPTTANLSASLGLNSAFDAFHLVTTGFSDLGPESLNQLVSLDLATGNTSFLTNVDSAAGPIFGAAPVPEPASIALAGIGFLAVAAFRRRRIAE